METYLLRRDAYLLNPTSSIFLNELKKKSHLSCSSRTRPFRGRRASHRGAIGDRSRARSQDKRFSKTLERQIQANNNSEPRFTRHFLKTDRRASDGVCGAGRPSEEHSVTDAGLEPRPDKRFFKEYRKKNKSKQYNSEPSFSSAVHTQGIFQRKEENTTK